MVSLTGVLAEWDEMVRRFYSVGTPLDVLTSYAMSEIAHGRDCGWFTVPEVTGK